MTENDYYIAWGIYAFAALGCLLVWFRLTRWLWRWLREPLRVLAAVLLLCPTIVDPAKEQFAPAIAISALDLLFKVAGNAWRAISDLAMYSVIALAIYAVFALIRWPLERSARARRAERQAEDERRARRAAEESELFKPEDAVSSTAELHPRSPSPSIADRAAVRSSTRVEPRL